MFIFKTFTHPAIHPQAFPENPPESRIAVAAHDRDMNEALSLPLGVINQDREGESVGSVLGLRDISQSEGPGKSPKAFSFLCPSSPPWRAGASISLVTLLGGNAAASSPQMGRRGTCVLRPCPQPSPGQGRPARAASLWERLTGSQDVPALAGPSQACVSRHRN